MKKISVIASFFNDENSVCECVNSVLAQSLSDIEIICVNNGSIDGTAELLHKYEMSNDCVKVLDEVHTNQTVSLNKATKIATGEYIYFIDSHSIITSRMFEELYDICKEKDLDVIRFSGALFYENDNELKKYKKYENTLLVKSEVEEAVDGKSLMARLIGDGDYTTAPELCLIRRSILQKCGIEFCDRVRNKDESFVFKLLMNAEKTCSVSDVYVYKNACKDMFEPSETSEKARDILTNTIDMMHCVDGFANDIVDVQNQIVRILSQNVLRLVSAYRKLPRKEQAEFIGMCNPCERIFFKSVLLEPIQIENKNLSEIKKLKGELAKIKESRSYKLGRNLTAPYRYAKGFIKKIFK